MDILQFVHLSASRACGEVDGDPVAACGVVDQMLDGRDDPHLVDAYLSVEGGCSSYVVGRSMIVKKAQRIPVECVVRGYLSGSAWADYCQRSTVFGEDMPPGLGESQEFPQPLFTPTTKAESGHDQPLTMEEMRSLIGEELAEEIRVKSLDIYRIAREYAQTMGIIIADTKMEFGLIDGKLSLIDELLTPDSSRFWEADKYQVGHPQPSFDKQPVRDWLIQAGWDKEPPAPMLPPEIVEQTTRRYCEAYRKLTGRELKD